MRVEIEKINIIDNPSNEVTSHKLFKTRKVFDNDGNLDFHPDGIFSDRIFGKFGKCKCGALTSPGICEICDTRVLNKRKIPDFYIKFDNLDIPFLEINTSKYPKYKNTIINLLNYNGFLYDNQYVEYDLDVLDITQFDTEKILFGKDAILSLGVDEAWYYSQVSNKFFVPHTSLRKITVQEDTYFLGELNTLLVEILKRKNKLKVFEGLSTEDTFTQLSIRKELISNINNVYSKLYEQIAKRKKSILNREVRGQGVTGAIRATITNNFELDEDTVILGYWFIPTLYPHLYYKYTNEEGYTDIAAINDELKDYLVLVNRQPTIGEKSIIACHPVFSDKDNERFVMQINPLVMDGLAGDYDGDVLFVIALYTKEACLEAKRLLPSRNYQGGSNGDIRNAIFEDLDYVMKKSYEDNTAEKIHNIINNK